MTTMNGYLRARFRRSDFARVAVVRDLIVNLDDILSRLATVGTGKQILSVENGSASPGAFVVANGVKLNAADTGVFSDRFAVERDRSLNVFASVGVARLASSRSDGDRRYE